jgi:hypothetical protein
MFTVLANPIENEMNMINSFKTSTDSIESRIVVSIEQRQPEERKEIVTNEQTELKVQSFPIEKLVNLFYNIIKKKLPAR